METTQKILPDPDLHYGIAQEDREDYIEKAPQRSKKARRAEQMQKMASDTTFEESRPVGHSSGAPAYTESLPSKEEA